jgi:hypothetical protein
MVIHPPQRNACFTFCWTISVDWRSLLYLPAAGLTRTHSASFSLLNLKNKYFLRVKSDICKEYTSHTIWNDTTWSHLWVYIICNNSLLILIMLYGQKQNSIDMYFIAEISFILRFIVSRVICYWCILTLVIYHFRERRIFL